MYANVYGESQRWTNMCVRGRRARASHSECISLRLRATVDSSDLPAKHHRRNYMKYDDEIQLVVA